MFDIQGPGCNMDGDLLEDSVSIKISDIQSIKAQMSYLINLSSQLANLDNSKDKSQKVTAIRKYREQCMSILNSPQNLDQLKKIKEFFYDEKDEQIEELLENQTDEIEQSSSSF